MFSHLHPCEPKDQIVGALRTALPVSLLKAPVYRQDPWEVRILSLILLKNSNIVKDTYLFYVTERTEAETRSWFHILTSWKHDELAHH